MPGVYVNHHPSLLPVKPESYTPEEISRLSALFNARLLAASSATAVLEEWCGGSVIVRRVPVTSPLLTSEQKKRLQIQRDDEVIYRRVELLHGDAVLSYADNWYRPDRLPREMHAALQNTQIPFGIIVRSLRPTRHTLGIQPLAPPFLVEHRALLSVDGHSLCEVHERYTEALIYSNQSG